MKTIHHVILLMFILTLSACVTTAKFPVSTIVPAAEGIATIKKDKNNNYMIKLNVKYLASPERLTPPKKYYVAWIATANGTNTNIGMLIPNKKNNATLKCVTSFKPTLLFVTAEDTGDTTLPGTPEIFRTDNLKLK